MITSKEEAVADVMAQFEDEGPTLAFVMVADIEIPKSDLPLPGRGTTAMKPANRKRLWLERALFEVDPRCDVVLDVDVLVIDRPEPR